jgi:integrase
MKKVSYQIKGLKTYCKICRKDNPKCEHPKFFRGRIHIPGTKNGIRSKIFETENYQKAVYEFLEFKQYVEKIDYLDKSKLRISNQITLSESFELFGSYFRGEGQFIQFKKERSEAYIKQVLKHIEKFIDVISENKLINPNYRLISQISKNEMTLFYQWQKNNNIDPLYFNKHISSVRLFFDFIIHQQGVKMENPTNNIVKLRTVKKDITSLSTGEFNQLLNVISTENSMKIIGNQGHRKNMYRDYLKDAFKLLLFTGGRLEEIINLKWSNIIPIEHQGKTYFKFIYSDLKVNRIQKKSTEKQKSTMIHADLLDFLNTLGLNDKIGNDEFIICPDRTRNVKNLIDQLSKSFTHYRDLAGLRKEISIKHLRKTYITWINSMYNDRTFLLTGHSNNDIVKKYYVNSAFLTHDEIELTERRMITDL